MLSKPFKLPLLRPDSKSPLVQTENVSIEPPSKRRRISDDADELQPSNHSKVGRKPLVIVKNPPSPEEKSNPTENDGVQTYYMVLWRKFTTKKHKTWDGDGVLILRGGYAILKDISGREMGRIQFNGPLLPGSTLSIGGKDVEIDEMITREQFMRIMRQDQKHADNQQNQKEADNRQSQKQPDSHQATESIKPAPTTTHSAPSKPLMSIQAQMKAQMQKEKEEAKRTLNVAAPRTKASKVAFKNPVKESTIMPKVPGGKPVPRHDPNAIGALVMKRPKKAPQGKQIVDVVLDPILTKNLREHQREGVKFLYECVMGLRDFNGEGCILADEMGLGKTLQTIALLWTLLKQNPISEEPPVIKKALIVCPVTLIVNWQKEFRKWLGNERIGVFVADGKKTRLTDFTMGKSYSVMIIGYERLRTVAEDLNKGSGIDIVIADEGHRLKTVQNKSAQAIQSLNTPKRIILSGTPIQNDLTEFFSMVNFVNDGLLGSYKSFVKNFETPIVRSRQPNALEKDIEKGEARSEELAESTKPFILRRTADILSHYLPPKSEYVLFCNPTPVQANIYRQVLASPIFQSALGNSESALQLITILKKLCNSPSLLSAKAASADDTSTSASIMALLSTLPSGLLKTFGNNASTKIRVLDRLLYSIRTHTDEKVVLVSNYTSTLDLLQTLLTSTSMPFLRLDGSTPASKRQGIVDDFNRSSARSCFVFLLSAKAGGMGLNLIGASRLILFDVDWNPATDDQAMARIHREGQKRSCRIYRFLVKGGLEERIWQRQVVKRGLADSILEGGSGGIGSAGGGGSGGGGKNGVAQFSRDELMDLFRLDENKALRTHELIDCPCGGLGGMPDKIERAKAEISAIVDEEDMNQAEVINDTDDYSDSSPSLPEVSEMLFTKASQLTNGSVAERESQIALGTHPEQPAKKRADAKKKREDERESDEMSSLRQYAHLDTSIWTSMDQESEEWETLRDIVDDPCLMDVLSGDSGGGGGGGAPAAIVKGGGGVAYVFKKEFYSKAAKEVVMADTQPAENAPQVQIKEEGVKAGFFLT